MIIRTFLAFFSSSILDIFPTIVTLTNSTLPANRKFDGIDISAILRGRAHKGHQVRGGIRWAFEKEADPVDESL